MAVLMPEGRQSFEDSAGQPLVGGKLYTYLAGTNTPSPTYKDPGETTLNTNPIILDGRGECVVFWTGAYKVVHTDADDVVIWTQDNIISADINGAADTLREELASASNPALGAQLVGLYSNGVAQADTVGERLADLGPSSVVMTGVGTPAFTGGGLNNATFAGTYNGSRPLSVVVRINTAGVPDTLALSCDGGVTFVTTEDIYDPMTDSYTTGPIPIVAGPMSIFGTGLTVTFGTTTGHTAGNQWAIALTPNSATVNNTGKAFKLSGEVFAHAFGTKSTGLGLGTFAAGTSIGVENTGLGYDSLRSNKTGYANTGVGADSLKSNTTGFFNQAFGVSCLRDTTTGRNNSGFGTYTLLYNTSGRDNSAFGVDSQVYNLTGYENSSLGVQSMYLNRNGFQNVAFGLYAMRGGTESTAAATGKTDTELSPQYGVALGAYAAYHLRASVRVTAVGFESLFNCTGSRNVALGGESGYRLTSGTDNIFLGDSAGANVLQKVDALNSICLGDNTYTTGNNSVAIGSGVNAGANEIVIANSQHLRIRPMVDNNTNFGQSTFRWATIFAATGAINTSDENSKQDIEEIPDAWLDAWADVKWRRFKFKDAVAKKGDDARWHIGLVAQEVWRAFDRHGIDALEIGLCCRDEDDGREVWGIRYDEAQAVEAAWVRRELGRLSGGMEA